MLWTVHTFGTRVRKKTSWQAGAKFEDVPMDVDEVRVAHHASREDRDPRAPPYVRIGRFPHIVPAFPERIREPDEVQMPALRDREDTPWRTPPTTRTKDAASPTPPGARTTPAEIVLSTAKISHPVCQIGRPGRYTFIAIIAFRVPSDHVDARRI